MVDFRNKPILPFLTCGLISGLAIAAPGPSQLEQIVTRLVMALP